MIFLGGSCGVSDWRRQIAIPALQAAGLEYFDPQLAPGAWTEADEARDMREKERASVLLFVIEGSTRAVASLAEVAYLIASGRPLALAVADLQAGVVIDGRSLEAREIDDLNRGRLFVRTMAAHHHLPCFTDAVGAVAHAIALSETTPLDLARLRAILAQIECGSLRFAAVANGDELHLQVADGRLWHVRRDATHGEVVQTALKAALTWEEHELRERFRYRGRVLFDPHFDLEVLLSRARKC
jgi:hypothetical protein